jgi:DNA polymerase IV (DinB-like DNA polymerase)
VFWKGRVIVHVDMNAFYPSCEQVAHPELAGRPVVVIMTPERGEEITRGAVASCSYEARQFGIHSGMSFRTARDLCPEAVFVRTHFDLYEKFSAKVMKTLREFADLLEVASIDEAYLECTKMSGRYESPRALGEAIKRAVREKVGLRCSVGIAPTMACAKIASDYVKPDGLTVVSPEELKRFLGPLEVSRVAGIGPKTQAKLEQMGIRTLGELSSTPSYKLTEKFGKIGLWMWKVANGLDDERVVENEEYKSLSTEHTLASETTERAVFETALQEMAISLHARMTELGIVYRTVGIKLVYSDFRVTVRDYSYPDYKSDLVSLTHAALTLLDRVRPSVPVRKLGLKVSKLLRIDPRQTRIEKWIQKSE